MNYNITQKVKDAWKYYDDLLDKKIKNISKLSNVNKDKLIKINPAEFIEKIIIKLQTIMIIKILNNG